MAERLLPTKAASSTAEPAEKEERVENRAQDNSPEAASEVDLEAAIVTSTASQSQPQEPCSARAECVICLGDLDGEGERTLSCNHTFHSGCITEWLEANGKCPVCRRVIDEAAVARAADRDRERSVAGVLLDPRIARVLRASVDAVESTQTMHAESRRLMMFATMQAALSVLVMSYVTDVLSPPLMLLSATMIFIGASNFSLRAIAMCRPVLCMNVMYHLFLVTRMVHQTEAGPQFFNDDYTNTRAVLLSVGCVALMEAVALKKVGIFYFRLLTSSDGDIARMRRMRRTQGGTAQRAVVVAMFVLICVPVLARYLCMADVDLGDVCVARR